MKKKAYIHTFGCQMNEYDSARMMGLLASGGFENVDIPQHADLIIVNTCSVRDKAEQKVYSLLGRLKKFKRERGTIIAVGGCVAQQIGDRIFKNAPYVDIVFGTHNIEHLPRMISEAQEGRERVHELQMNEIPSTFQGDQYVKEGAVKAFVTIMQGCDNFCSYCIVPFVRGGEYSRPAKDVVQEVKNLSERGVKEVTLLGQNVNSYGKKEGVTTFADLLTEVSEIAGIERIRFVTSHPRDFSIALIRCFSTIKTLCPHVHLPAQSGSDRVLEKMRRGYTKRQYLRIIEELLCERGEITFSSDFIVGFPGETDEDFNQTIGLIKQVGYDSSFSFKFSPRPGTAAAGFSGRVDETTQKMRLLELQSLQKHISLHNYRTMVGKNVKVLVEGKSKTDDNRYTGRTGCNKIVNFHTEDDMTGRIVEIKITAAFAHHLRGTVEKGG